MTANNPLLNFSGLEGMRGSVLYCPDCKCKTVHFTAPGGVPVCGFCGDSPDQQSLPANGSK